MREASRRVAQRIQASDVGTGSEGGVESTGVGDHRAGLHGSDLIACGDFFVPPHCLQLYPPVPGIGRLRPLHLLWLIPSARRSARAQGAPMDEGIPCPGSRR